MKRIFLLMLTFVFFSCKSGDDSSPQELIPSGEHYGDINNQGINGIVVFALDTDPNIDSFIYRKIVKGLGYRYKMFRASTQFPMPAKGKMFKQSLWYHRTLRYIAELKKLAENDIVIFSDVRDVTFFGSAEEVMNEFKRSKKRILISSTFQCCTQNLIPYIKEYARKINSPLSIKDESFPTIKEQDEMKKIWDKYHKDEFPARADADTKYKKKWPSRPFLENFRAHEENFKISNNQFVNAGTVIGYRDDFLKALAEIDPKPWSDDEEDWNLWFSKLENNSTYSPDYKESIFGIVNSPERPYPNELVVLGLADLYPMDKFPYKEFFRYQIKDNNFFSHWGEKTKIFHCPGCTEKEVAKMRKNITDLLFQKNPKLKNLFTPEELERITKI